MPNYKQRPFATIGHMGHQVEVPVGTEKVLYYHHNDLATKASLKHSEPEETYVVPSEKTFHAVGLWLLQTLTGTYTLHSGDTLNAQTTQMIKLEHMAIQYEVYYPLKFVILSGKYLTGKPSGTAVKFAIVVGYET